MKRIILPLILALCCIPASADKVLDSFISKLASSILSFNYSFTLRSDMSINGKGSAEISGTSFHISGDGVDIWNSGDNLWTVDNSAKEVIIESTAGLGMGMNPAAILSNISSAFKEVSSGNDTYKGASYHTVKMHSIAAGSEIKEILLYFNGSRLMVTKILLLNGDSMTVEFSQMSFSEGLKTMSFNTSSLDKSWIVTDLR